MCLAVPGRIKVLKDGEATVDYGSQQRNARVFDGDYAVGDYVLVQMGFVAKKLDPKEAREAIKLWKSVEDQR